MSWLSFLAPVLGNVIGGITQNGAIGDARDDANQGYDRAMGAWNDALGRVNGMWQPYQQAGAGGLSRAQGYVDGTDNRFMDSGAYKFAVGQGEDSLKKLAAARGGFFGGGLNKDMLLFGQNAANRFGNDYFAQNMGLAQMGQNANSNLTQFNATQAGSIADLLSGQGENNANARLAQGNNTAGMWGGIGGALGNWLGG